VDVRGDISLSVDAEVLAEHLEGQFVARIPRSNPFGCHSRVEIGNLVFQLLQILFPILFNDALVLGFAGKPFNGLLIQFWAFVERPVAFEDRCGKCQTCLFTASTAV
jgi:hypothetical protein